METLLIHLTLKYTRVPSEVLSDLNMYFHSCIHDLQQSSGFAEKKTYTLVSLVQPEDANTVGGTFNAHLKSPRN